MKKLTKLATFLASIALVFGMLLPVFPSVYADPGYYQTNFAVENIPETYVIGEDEGGITVSKINDADIFIKIYDPSSKVIQTILSTGTDYNLVPTKLGDYRIVYFYDAASDIQIAEKVITVTKVGYYFEFPTNTERIIPSELNISYTDAILLPMPAVFAEKDDEEVEGAVITITLSKPEGSTATITGDEEKLFDPDVVGEYRFIYTYKIGDVVFASKTYTMTVNDSFDNDYELGYSFKSTKPTTAVIGVATTLPDVQGKNTATGDIVDVYYDITVRKDGTDVTSTVLDADTREFTATQNGDYVVSYRIYNVFGNYVDSIDFTIADVKDSQAPVVYFGKLVGDDIVDQSYDLPSVTDDVNIILPAIYATDNSSGEISYTRSIKSSSSATTTTLDTENPLKAIVLNYDETDWAANMQASYGDIADYVYSTESTSVLNKVTVNSGSAYYKVIYKAVDEAGKTTSKTLQMKVYEEGTATTPVINFETVLPSYVKLGEDVTFTIPTATDEKDERILVKTYYQYNGGEEVEFEATTSSSYNLSVGTAGTLNIIVRVTNDYGNAAELTKTLSVIDIDDSVAPTFEIGDLIVTSPETNIYDVDLEQFNEILVPEITFGDDNIGYLGVKIFVKDEDGTNYNVYGKQIATVGNEKTISSAKFLAAKSGQYYITYVATDIGGNFNVVVLETANVEGTVAPSIVNPIFTSSSMDLELGESLALPIPSVRNGDGDVVEDPTYSIVMIETDGDYEILDNQTTFVPYQTGTYMLKYRVTDGSLTVDSVVYTINVQDTNGPTITTSYDGIDLTVEDLETPFEVLKLTATDNGGVGVDEDKSKIEIKLSSTVKKTLTETSFGDDDVYEYTFTDDGSYTILYTCYDLLGNSTTKSFTVKVGDTDKPVITLDSDLTFGDKTVGSSLVIDLADITVSDLKDTDIAILDEDGYVDSDVFSIVVKNTTTGTTISNKLEDEDVITGYEFDLSTVGTYSVTFTLTDGAGNTTSIEKTFVVSADAADTSFPTQTIGIILIVVSVVILAGVVVYFVLTRKKSLKKTSK